MAKAQTTPDLYDEDAEYYLRVSRPVKLGPFRYLPRDEITAKGRVINRIVEQEGADAIRNADKR
ncbi:MAG: hypothetical protein H6887_00650 [Hoeflea sp.]|nr:hypothetical protein [Hoeflea sp.]